MADAKKVIIGQRMDRFPGATWNALVEGELKRRGNTTPGGGPTATQFSPAIIQIIWDEDSELTPGAAVALREAMIDPADDASAPYNGIVFHAETPADGDVDSPRIAIATSPILAQYGVGSAVMPNCVWAKVDVVDEADTHAGAVSGQLSLESGTTGQYPIVWKKATGTGDQWAVVAMGAGGDGVALICKAEATSDAADGVYSASITKIYQGGGVEIDDVVSVNDDHDWGIVDTVTVKIILPAGGNPFADNFDTMQADCIPPEV